MPEKKEARVPDHAYPTDTPNVVIEDPQIREIVYTVLGWAGVILTAAVAADAVAPAFDISAFTQPAFAVYGVFAAAVGRVARKNIPA